MPTNPRVYWLAQVSKKTPAGTFQIEVLRVGNWDYYGTELKVTTDTLKEFKTNFDKKSYFPVPVDGPDPDIEDSGAHSENELADCGFIQSLQLSADKKSLFATLDVTKPAIAKAMDEGSLAYCSSELAFNWYDPSTKEQSNVLTGLGLTNRPFIKGMEGAKTIALNLSEFAPTGSSEDMDTTNDQIKKLEAEIISLKEAQGKASSADSVELKELKTKYEMSLKEKQAYEFALKEQENKTAIASVTSALDKAFAKGAVRPKTAEAIYALADAIVKGGVRSVKLAMSPVDSDGQRGVYDGSDTGGIKKCDLIDMLTETINSLPGDTVHVKPMGNGFGDQAPVDDNGQMDSVNDDEGNSQGSAPGKFKFSDRYKPQVDTRRGVTTEVVLKEANALADKDRISITEALKIVLTEKGIKSINEVK